MSKASDEDVLSLGYMRAALLTRDKAKSFFFASRFLPKHKRRGVFAVYEFCRVADDLVDERGDRPVETVRQALATIGQMVRRLPEREPPEDVFWHPLHDTFWRANLDTRPFLELLEGVERDLVPLRFENTAELMHYSHQVAGVVGLMLGPLLGASRRDFDEAGIQLGVAMQLTNILRDVGSDWRRGRVYLPASELARFNLDHAAIEAGEVTEAWRAFMEWQIARAREYFAAGDRVIDLFPQDGSRLTVRLMQQSYAGILRAIEAIDYDVFHQRAVVSDAQKLWILAKVMWQDGPRRFGLAQ